MKCSVSAKHVAITNMKIRSRLILDATSGIFLLAADQFFKYSARANPSYSHYLVNPWLGWEYLANPGTAFGLPIPNTFLILATPIIIFGLAILLIKKHKKKSLLSLGLTFIIAGAISNFIDRVLFEATIDYIRVLTGVINLADALIVGGAVLVLIKEPCYQETTELLKDRK